MNQTVLVDWSLFTANPYTQDFVASREGQARMVLLVSDPTVSDYNHETLPGVPDIEWDAVIRNTGALENVMFKATALSVIQDASNLIPVIALDANTEINRMYREGGILITVEDL